MCYNNNKNLLQQFIYPRTTDIEHEIATKLCLFVEFYPVMAVFIKIQLIYYLLNNKNLTII